MCLLNIIRNSKKKVRKTEESKCFDWISEIYGLLKLLKNIQRNSDSIQSMIGIICQKCIAANINESEMLEMWSQQISPLFAKVLFCFVCLLLL